MNESQRILLKCYLDAVSVYFCQMKASSPLTTQVKTLIPHNRAKHSRLGLGDAGYDS